MIVHTALRLTHSALIKRQCQWLTVGMIHHPPLHGTDTSRRSQDYPGTPPYTALIPLLRARGALVGYDGNGGDLQHEARAGREPRYLHGRAGRTVIAAPGYGDRRVDRILIRILVDHEAG